MVSQYTEANIKTMQVARQLVPVHSASAVRQPLGQALLRRVGWDSALEVSGNHLLELQGERRSVAVAVALREPQPLLLPVDLGWAQAPVEALSSQQLRFLSVPMLVQVMPNQQLQPPVMCKAVDLCGRVLL